MLLENFARINPLSDNFVHARHDADVACSGCKAKSSKNGLDY